jgi:hypothetical protein
MMTDRILFEGELEYSYNHFLIFDVGEPQPGCAWTDRHVAQGFARRESTVGFSTLAEFGLARLRVFLGEAESLQPYERAIAVSFMCSSGTVAIEGPDEDPGGRELPVGVGCFEVLCCQELDDDSLTIDLFFRLIPVPRPSRILKADPDITATGPLLETAKQA